MWASGAKIRKNYRQSNFEPSWEHFLLKHFFCSSDTEGFGRGFLLRIYPRNIIPSDTVYPVFEIISLIISHYLINSPTYIYYI